MTLQEKDLKHVSDKIWDQVWDQLWNRGGNEVVNNQIRLVRWYIWQKVYRKIKNYDY